MQNINVIEVKNLSKSFGSFKAVDSVSFEVKKGEIFGILGPNGAGKTTLVRMLATLLQPDSGSAILSGIDLEKNPQIIRRMIGLTGQYASIDEELSAYENLAIFCKLNGLTKKESAQRIDDLLKEFSLEYAKDRALKNFSGGMRRRLDLAVSLIAQPKIIFLDEPTTGLDPRTRGEMWETIKQLVNNGATVVLTTQYLEEADQLADRMMIIDHGAIIAMGTAKQLKQKIGSSTLEISLQDEHQLAKGKTIVENVTNETVQMIQGENMLRLPMENVDFLSPILTAFSTEKITVEQLSVRQPSLDEVFLTLTNK